MWVLYIVIIIFFQKLKIEMIFKISSFSNNKQQTTNNKQQINLTNKF